MSFSDWLKEYRESQGTKESASKPTASTSNKATPISTMDGPSDYFSDWLKEYREKTATASLEGWAETSINLIKDVQNYSNRWHGNEYQDRDDRFTHLLGLASNWRNQYADNSDALSYIDSVVTALDSAKKYNYDNLKYYSQFKTKEDYVSYLNTLGYIKNLGYDYDSAEAKTGWDAYTAKKDSKPAEDANKSAFEKALERFAYSSDSTLPGANVSQVVHDYQKDTSYREPNDKWSDYQKNAFGYLYSKDPEQAWAFAEKLNNQTNREQKATQTKAVQESATKSFWSGAGHTAGSIATAPLALADYLDAVAEYNARGRITEKADLTPGGYSRAVTSGVSEHLNDEYGTLSEKIPVIGGKGLGDVYGLGTSAAQSMIGGHVLGQAGTLISFFGSSGAAAIEEAKNRGATDEQALAFGTVSGAAEALTEMIPLDTLMNLGPAANWHGLFANVIKQGGEEAWGEGLNSAITAVADYLTFGDLSNYETMKRQFMENGFSEEMASRKAFIQICEDVAFDSLGGMVTGGFSASIETGIQTGLENNLYRKTYGDSAAELVAEGLESAEGTASHDLAKKLQEKMDSGKSLSGSDIRKMVQANEQQFLAEDKASIKQAAEARLTELGETDDVGHLAEILTKQVSGEKLTKEEQFTLGASMYGQRVSNELNPQNIESGEFASGWAEKIGTNRINADSYNTDLMALANEVSGVDASRTDPKAPGQELHTASDKVVTENNQSTQSQYEASESGETIIKSTGEAVGIKEVATIKDGQMTLKLTDGRTVDAMDIEYASQNDAMVYEAVANMGVNVASANVLLKAYHPDSGVPAGVYAKGIQEAYRYGQYNYPMQEMAKGPFSSMLTDYQRNTAYKLGKMFSGKQVAKQEATVRNIRSVATGKKSSVSGKVHFDGNRSSLTERQSASLSTLETVADVLGVQIYVFESKVGENGKRIGANGWYNPKDNSIHIDLHAGASGEATMLFTAAHELTHFIKQWSPAKFKILANFLMAEYGQKGVSVETLVQKQIAKAERNGRTISYDTAYEEVIADSMETMLADGNVMEKLAKLKQQDKSLWQKIKDFISDLAAKIRSVYEGLTPDSEEGRYVAEMKDAIEALQDLFVEGLVDASANYQASEQVLAQAGIAVNTTTDSGSLMSVRDVLNDADRKKVAKALADRFKVTEKEAMEWLTAETSLASLILNPKYSSFLDYEADPNEVAIKQNSDYPQGTVDFSNICKKRREFTQVMNRILRNFPNHVFAATDLAKIRTIMGEEGMTLPCGICYVEDRRQLDTIVAQDFINGLKLYREGSKTRPDGKPFNANQLKGLQITDGDTYVPTIYELVSLEGRNSLKAKNPNMEAAWVRYNNARGMQSVRLLTNEAEYKRQILKYSKKTVQSKNDHGGLRIYSFSDAEMFHLIDIIQVITDSATVGLSLQGYTKVNEYAKAVKDTGEKLNRSLIPKGDLGYHIENGKVVLDYDTVEGIDIYHEDFFDNKDNPNVGNITIGINDTQIRAAMVSDFVDQIIPFHTGQSEEVLGEKGIAAWDNYKDFQTEKDLATGKTSSHQINIYTEVFQAAEEEGKPIQNKRQFVEKFLDVCKKNGLKPRFAQFLNTDANGDYIYTEGYHKFLVDFKTFAQTEVGEYLPQMPVKPIFDNAYITGLLTNYVTEQKAKDAEVAKNMPRVIERITNEIIKPAEVKLSDRDFSYKELTAKSNLKGRVIKANQTVKLTGDGSIDKAWVVKQVLSQCESVQTKAPIPTYFVNVPDIGKNVEINGESVRHGFIKSKAKNGNPVPPRSLLNARASLDLPHILQNSIEVNRSDRGDNSEVEFAHILIGVTAMESSNGKTEYYAVRSVVESRKNQGAILTEANVIGKLHAINAKKIGKPHAQVGTNSTVALTHSSLFDYSVANLLNDVKNEFDDTFSNDVYKHFGMTRTANSFSQHLKYSDRDTAPTFYSHMARVVDGVKQEKLGAASVVNMLRGKGVKAEEIKWSGIEEWLAGKKSVTKAELQGFIAGSMLQIEEDVLDNEEVPFSDDQQKRLDEYEGKRDEIANRLSSEWKKVTGDDWTIHNAGAGLESSLVNKIIDTNKEHKDASFEGRLLKKLRDDLKEVINSNDDFGFDNWRDALRAIHRHRKDFIKHYEMSSNDKAVIVKYCNALNAYNELPDKISDADSDRLRSIARETDPWTRKIMEVKHERNEESAKRMTNWQQYRLKGGKNYREVVFRLPGATYYNDAMYTHWKDKSGVLAHARVQDMETADGKMLFIEEIQSDWHNEGHKKGYTSNDLLRKVEAARAEYRELKQKLRNDKDVLRNDLADFYQSVGYDTPAEAAEHSLQWKPSMREIYRRMHQKLNMPSELMDRIDTYQSGLDKMHDLGREEFALKNQYESGVPDAPFRDNYHEYVLKRLIREAAEKGYDSIGWTPADIQSDRWSDEYAEGYRIEYDQDIPKFLNKYGKKWGAKVSRTPLPGLNSKATYYDVNREEQFDSFTDWQETVRSTLYEQGVTMRNVMFKQIDDATWISYDKQTGIEYDRATVSKTSDSVWSMEITDAMRESVLTEGQPLYSDRETDSVSNRSLLANALESVAKNDIERKKIQEYKEKISLINSEEKKLRSLNKQIKDMSFGKGHYDAAKVRELQFEAKQTANRINTYDRQLLRLEASKPLQDVLTREKKMAYDRGVQRGKEALDAYRERTEKKQQEIIEKYQESRKRSVENRQKAEMRKKIRKTIRDLDKILNRGDKKRNVKEDMKDFVAEALVSAEILFTDSYSNEDMVRNGVTTDMTPEEAKLMDEARAIMEEIANLPSGSYEAMMGRYEQEQKLKGRLAYRMAKLRDVFVRERARLNKTQVSEVLGNLADSYARLQNSEYAHVQGAYHESVYEYLKMLQEDVGGTIVKDMTIGQLEELYKAYTMAKTTVFNANRMFAENLNNTRDALANRVMFEVHEAGGEHGLWSKAADKLNSFSWNNEKPVYAFERIGSNTLKTLYGNIRKGQDVWAVNLQEANNFRRSMYTKHKHNAWDLHKMYKFTSASGIDFELNLDQIMSLYAYSKREQAHDHLLKGGFVFDGNTEVVVNKHGLKMTYLNKNATAYNVSFELLEQIISKLTPDQKAFVDEMQDYLSTTMGEKGNEVSMELYGVKLFNEKFYFPLRSAGQYMERAKEADLKKEQGQINIANSGFSKSVKIHASNPVVLAGFMDVWAGHVNEMSMYNAFVLPMEDFRRVYNYSSPHMEGQQSASVNGVIQNAYGAAATDYIDQLYRDLNGGALADNRTGPINKLMNLFKKGAVFASASVTIQQPSAIARATALVDVKYFFGPKVDHKRHDALWAEVKKYAPVAVIKEMGFFDTNMGRSATDFLTSEEYNGIKQKAEALVKDESYRDEMLSKAPALADELTWCAIWEAVKRETKAKHPGMSPKSEEFLKLAGERFSEVIDKTQVYDSVLARSANMRSKDTGMKMATAFMAEPTTSINMVADAIRKGKKGNKKYATRAVSAVVASVILNSFLVAFVQAARDDDEDESYTEKYLGNFVAGIVDGLNPATYIPFLKDIVSIMQGYDVERSDMSVVSDMVNSFRQLISNDVSGWKKVEGFVGSICQIFGIPAKNMMRDARSAYQAYNTIVNGEDTTSTGIKYAIKEAITGKSVSNKDQLYEARLAGDEEHTARVEARYAKGAEDAEDAAKSADAAVRDAIKDRYLDGDLTSSEAYEHLLLYANATSSEINWMIDKWNYIREVGSDDGYSKYNKFYEAVETGKDLKAVIKMYTDNDVERSTLSKQITDHFKPEYVEMSASERTAIKGYLINALMETGSTRDEAESRMADWDFEANYGFSYDKRETAYMEGKVTSSELRAMYLKKGKTEEEADNLIEAHEWLKAHGRDDLYASKVQHYVKPIEGLGYSIEDTGMDIDVYLESYAYVNKIEGNGEAYSRINQAFPYINDLNLTPEQKTALAVACGWGIKTVNKNKLW